MTLAPSWYALQQARQRRRMVPRRAHADAVTALQAALRFERDWTVLASAARTVLDSQCLLPHEEAAARAVLDHVAAR